MAAMTSEVKFDLRFETSDFETEAGEWRYTTGLLHDDTGKLSIGRNDACLCDSGKKFKQCCLKRL